MKLPVELQAVFRRNPDAKAKFESNSPSHQNEYIKYIIEAKKAETRLKRADKVVIMLTERKLSSVYKPKTIPEVFGLKPDMVTKVVNVPKDYQQIMSDWQFQTRKPKTKLDFAHLFAIKKQDLERELVKLKSELQPNGMIWVSWLKKSSGLPSEIGENDVRELALSIGLVDVKVCAVSDIWSGLKLVIPLSQR